MAKLSDKKKRWIKNEAKDFSFLLPSLVIFIIIIIIPLISGIRYTFTDWNGMSKNINYVGLKNYFTVFQDKDLLLPIRNTAIFTLVTMVLINALGLGLAMMVEKEFKGVNVIKSIVIIPGFTVGAIGIQHPGVPLSCSIIQKFFCFTPRMKSR